jgi:hypothetical protein
MLRGWPAGDGTLWVQKGDRTYTRADNNYN